MIQLLTCNVPMAPTIFAAGFSRSFLKDLAGFAEPDNVHPSDRLSSKYSITNCDRTSRTG